MKIMSKTEKLTLKRNFSWNFVGSLIYSLSQFLVIIIINKFGNVELVGLYTLGLSVTAPIIMLTNLQLRQVQATDTNGEYQFNDYFGIRILMGFVALLITLIVTLIFDYELSITLVILVVSLIKVVDSYSEVIYGHLQQNERMDYIGVSRILKGVLNVSVFFIVLQLKGSLTLTLILITVGLFLSFLIYDVRKVRYFTNKLTPSFKITKMKGIITLTFPLGLMLMLGSLNTNIPRVLIHRFMGTDSLGYFASIAYLMVAGNLFISSLGQAVAPRLAKLYASGESSKFNLLLLKMAGLGALIGLMGVLVATILGEQILTIIYSSDYAKYNYLLILVMFASVFSYSASFLGYGLTAMRKFNIQPILGVIWSGVSLVTSIILIPYLGLKGAGYTLLISSIIQLLTIHITIWFGLNEKKQ